jgi:Lysozyme like domain
MPLSWRTAIAAVTGAALLVGGFLLGPAASAGTRPAAQGSQVAPLGRNCRSQSVLAGRHYSAVRIARVAKRTGFRGRGWVISVAVALAESGGWTRARHVNLDCSVDRGLWQINSYWHREVSDRQAFKPRRAARAAYRISAGGGDWTPWTTYDNGAYRAQMAQARAAVRQLGGP